MARTFRILVMCWVALATLAADEWLDTFGPDDEGAIAADAQLLPLCAPRIASVVPGSPAVAMGLAPGDLLVGLDGLRIHGSGEWELVRLRRPCVPGEMRVAVWRAGRLVRLVTHNARPVQRLGCDFSPPGDALERALDALARPPCGWESFPRRDAVAILRWLAGAPAPAARGWIADLARLYGLLAEQRWAEAAAVIVVPPAPDLAELAAFYHRLALRHAGGEQEPDPQLLGASAAWCTIHYPYPHLVLPPLGAFTHPDADFVAALTTLQGDPLGARHDRTSAAAALRPIADEDDYDFRVRQSLIDGIQQGGWPFRHEEVWDPARRRAIIARLSAVAEVDGPLAAWSRCCLVCPLLIERSAGMDGQGEWLRPVFDLIRQVRETSPLLGYLATRHVVHAMGMSGSLAGAGEALRPWLVAAALPVTARPSRLIELLRARDTGLEFQAIAGEDGRWPAHLAGIYAILHRSSTPDGLRQRLKAAADAPAAPDAAARDAALIAEWTECFGDACTHSDARLLASFAAPGRAAGLALDAVSTLLYRQSISERIDPAWTLTANDFLDRPYQQAAAVAGARAAAAACPWDDAAAATAAVRRAGAAWGTTAGTLVLADICAAHGREDLAAALRQRVLDWNQRIAAYLDLHHATAEMHQEFDARILANGVLSPAFVALAISRGERIAAGLPLARQRDSVPLGLAVAYLAAGRREDALAALGRFFGAGDEDKNPVYWCDGTPLTSAPACCAWVLKRIIAGGALTPEQRDRLRAQVGQAAVEDDVAAALGLPRKAPPRAPPPADANGF